MSGEAAGQSAESDAPTCLCVSLMDTSKCPVHGGDNKGWGRVPNSLLPPGASQ